MIQTLLRSKASVAVLCGVAFMALCTWVIREQRAEEQRVQERWKKLAEQNWMYNPANFDTTECVSCKKRLPGIRITPTETIVRSNIKSLSAAAKP